VRRWLLSALRHEPARSTPHAAGGGETEAALILVHGLWTPPVVFAIQAHRLQRRGYRVQRFGYPSVRATLAENVQALRAAVAATAAKQIDLVGHSLGGLLILDLLAYDPDPRLGRVVLLGTPSLGSYCARQLAALTGMPTLLGASIMEWLLRPPQALLVVPPGIEIGVVAGTRSFGLGRFLVPGLPQPNDGVVALTETRLPTSADFIALPVAHSQMLTSRHCALQIASFLEQGRFCHDLSP